MVLRKGIAVLGMGRMGLEHIKNILMSPRATLQWVVRQNLDDAHKLRDKYNLDMRCTTPDKIDHVLDDDSVDAVVIVAPTASHENYVKKSLNAGKAVFCEKPLTNSMTSTIVCYDIAAAKKIPLLCAFSRRFDPSVSQVYHRIRTGAHGPVRIVKTTSRDNPCPPLDYLNVSSGIFKDFTIHDLDICSWLVGSKPRTVFAQGVAFKPEIASLGDAEQVAVVLTYENGAVGVIDNGRWAPFGYDNRLEVICEKTLLGVANKPRDQVYVAGDQASEEPRVETDFVERYRDSYRRELDHFIDVIEGKAELLVTKTETLQAMRLADLCKQSLATQKVVPYTEKYDICPADTNDYLKT